MFFSIITQDVVVVLVVVGLLLLGAAFLHGCDERSMKRRVRSGFGTIILMSSHLDVRGGPITLLRATGWIGAGAGAGGSCSGVYSSGGGSLLNLGLVFLVAAAV